MGHSEMCELDPKGYCVECEVAWGNAGVALLPALAQPKVRRQEQFQTLLAAAVALTLTESLSL